MKLDENLKIDIIDESPKEELKPQLNENITYDSDDNVLPQDVLPIGFVSKPKPADEEIFDSKVDHVVAKVQETTKGPDKTPEIKVVKEEAVPPAPKVLIEKPIKLTKKGRPRKPMTSEHKAKLAIAREKAMAKKKYLATERKITRMRENKETQNKKDENFEELQATQKIELARLEKIEKDKEAAAEAAAEKEVKKDQAITRADLEEMSMRTLIAMETMRKKRKQEKKKARAEQEYQAQVMDTIKKAQPSWILNDSPFNDCF